MHQASRRDRRFEFEPQLVRVIVAARCGDLMTDAFDYGNQAELFDYDTAAELFTSKGRAFKRQPLGYRRFARAADAIRFAIEDMPPQLLQTACLEVDEVRFDSQDIRRLYDSAAYPLARPAVSPP
jgi:hypothetical protein